MDSILVLESFIITEADIDYVNKSFGDKAKDLGKRVLAFFKKIIDAVISFFGRLIGTKTLVHSKALAIVDQKMRTSYDEVESLVHKYEKNPDEFYNNYNMNNDINYHAEWVDIQEEIRRTIALNPDKKNYVRNSAFQKSKSNIIDKLRKFELQFSDLVKNESNTKNKTGINRFMIMIHTLTSEILAAYKMTTLGQRKEMVTVQFDNIVSTKV